MRIVLATGGSGGHLFPAIEVAKKLKTEGHNILFIGSLNLGQELIQREGFAFKQLQVKGLQDKGIGEKLKFGLLMIKGILVSLRYVKAFRPDVVVGFGGYGSFPVVLAAVLLKYPTLIHEQNVVPGRANAVLAKWVNKIAVSFAQSQQYFKIEKTVLTGCPCHVLKPGLNRKEIFKRLSLEEHRKTVLVFGGSQGSHRINREFVKAAKSLKEQLEFQVIHICGRKDYDGLKQQYAQLGIRVALFDFLQDMDSAYSVSDLVISRAGALSVTEIALAGIPAILIPYPHAQGHQRENASVLAGVPVIRVIEEKDISTLKLKEDILALLNHTVEDGDLAEEFGRHCYADADKRLATAVLELVK